MTDPGATTAARATSVPPSFNLVDEPWLPVIRRGVPTRASLREVAAEPDAVDGLDVSDSLAAVAALRQVLLPVWLDALGLPLDAQEWRARWERPRDAAPAVLDYLDQYRHRFDLFSPKAPFAQVPGLRSGKDATRPVSALLPDLPSGNNIPLFAPITENTRMALEPADAALALLACQCFDPAGTRTGAVGDAQAKVGKAYGNPTGPLGRLGVLVPLGATLAETLALNTPLDRLPDMPDSGDEDDPALGRPSWRREVPTPAWATRPADGLLDLLTWQARRIRLVPEEDGQGCVVVRRVVLTAGDRLTATPAYEPHTSWRKNQKEGASPPNLPRRLRPGRALWRGMDSLLATREPTNTGETSSLLLGQAADLRVEEALPPDARLRVLAVQVQYGDRSAVVEDVAVDLVPLPVAGLPADSPVREVLLTAAADAERLETAANRLYDQVREASGGEAVEPDGEGQRLGDTLVADLSPVVRRLLGGLQREPERVEEAARAWRDTARDRALRVVEPLLQDVPARTFLGQHFERGGKEWYVRLSTAERAYRHEVDALFPREQRQHADD